MSARDADRRAAKRPRFSYAEPSSDDSDLVAESDQLAVIAASNDGNPRSKRARGGICYADPPTDDDEDDTSTAATRTSLRISKLYSTHDGEAAQLPAPEPSPKRKRTDNSTGTDRAKHPRRMTTRQRAVASKSRPRATQGSVSSKKKHKTTRDEQPQVPSDGKVPDWQNLPYEILVDIFGYAAHPLREVMRPLPSRAWLVSAATICKAFQEPALAALYRSPPLFALMEPHQLLALLKKDRSVTSINYAVKIRRLDIHVATLSYSAQGLGVVNLADLMCCCPQLEEVYVSDFSDRPPFRAENLLRKRVLDVDEIVPKLCEHGVKLRGWKWHGDLMTCLDPALMATSVIEQAHQTVPFQNVQHLVLSHIALQNPHVSPKKGQNFDYVNLGACLAPLQNLRSLCLESCITESWEFLSTLPDNLQHMSITNNGWVHSSDVDGFLETHGSELLSLDLSHNRYLDLHFLPRLRENCPKLQSIKMDTTYYSPVALARDTSPLYDELLIAGLVPTWPKTLRVIEFMNLRKWQQPAAEAFLGSLQESAADLPDLRVIVVKAILSISWRDRAQFRDRYVHSMRRVFKRRASPPTAHLASFKLYREHVKKDSKRFEEQTRPTPASGAREPRRSARRIAAQEDSQEEESCEESVPVDSKGQPLPIQGLCEVVEVNVDNHRPLEVQFNEGDFMDSEQSGDEDWHEGARTPSNHGSYAW